MSGKKIVVANEDAAEAEPAKKKKGKLVLFLLAGGLLLGGGGAGAGLYAAGMIPGVGGGGEAHDPNQPQLVLKDGSTEYPPKGMKAPDPKRYKASYLPLEENFTSNLRDADGFMQLSLGVSTFYDERVLEHVKTHEMPIRSAVLMALANQDGVAVQTEEGKRALQKELALAMNKVLESKEGFGGIDSVYFTNFIVQ